MKVFTLNYWRKKDGIVHSLEFDTKTYKLLKNKIGKLLDNVIGDIAGYDLQKNGKTIKKERF